MGTKITAATIAGAYASVTELNTNFALLANEFDKVVYRDGTAPNSWSADQDANSKKLLNLPDAGTNQEPATLNQLNNAILAQGGVLLATTPFGVKNLAYGETTASLTTTPTLTFVDTSDAEEFSLVGNSTTANLATTASLVYFKALGAATDIDIEITPKGSGKLHTDRFGQIGEHITTASVTTNYAIDLSKGTVFELTMTGDTIFTFTNPLATGIGQSFTVVLKQDGTGTWTATLPTIKWAAGTAPTLSTGASQIDILSFFTPDGGTTWYGFSGGTAFA